ncbi:MAG: preprotein translocase subunit SecG [Treponema sp.]|nr:preprotein translocase subunit SecG [Treponema sp.]
MGVVGIVLLVVFIIVCALLVLLVSIQDDGENGMGGLLGGRGSAAFGSHSASVLTKTTCVLTVLFFVLAFGLALVNKKPKVDSSITSSIEAETAEDAEAVTSDAAGNWWASTEDAE